MKKTIVAAAVAAFVSVPAFADVSVSGNVYGEATDSDAQVFTDLFFKASEDLGNGMKASSKIQIVGDNGGEGAGEQSVALSGDFGTITAGRFESYTEGSVAAMAANDPSHQVSIEPNVGNSGWLAAARYTSPSMSGAKFIIESDEAADVSTMAVEYSNAGLTVKYAAEDNAGTDVTTIAASYKMGDAKATIVNFDADGADSVNYIGVDYTMGANNIAYAMIDGGANDGDSTLSLKHSLSKSTSAYIAMKNDDSASDTTTVVGILQKF
jgi:hypothetical protein